MESLFLSSGFLAVAGALVSVPIIIHLINRMRFKRIRWAAMEFLLKAQKRKRKRLIIEQLLLLALRCLLIALVGLLVARFIGPSFAAFGSKPVLHVVVLDDTVSMHQEWDVEGKDKDRKTAFQSGIDQVSKIADAMKKAGAADELVILPVSRLMTDPDFQPTYFKYLADENKQTEAQNEIKKLEPSLLHVPMPTVLNKLNAMIEARQGNRIELHLVGDFRYDDWDRDKTGLQKELAALTQKHKDMTCKITDVLLPARTKDNVPESPENVSIVDLRPATRVVSKTMRMEFVMKLANFSAQDHKVQVQVFDELTGEERLDVNFRVSLPITVPAKRDDVIVTFDLPPSDPKKDRPYKAGHLLISAKLMHPDNKYNPLDYDKLPTDNKRYASVEVRDGVPVLIVDGRGRSKKDIVTQDWFFVGAALDSAPNATYDITFGEDLGGGIPTRALDRSDLLGRFAAVYLLNVTDLTTRQIANLESYVAAGGGVGFFMGPEVSRDFYNQKLHKDGKGVFPVELTEVVTARLDDLEAKEADKQPQDLILRKMLFADLESYPIFGKMLRDGMNERNFENVNVSKYYRVKRPERKVAKKEEEKDDGKPRTANVLELATLPSEKVIDADVTKNIGRVFFPEGADEPWNKVLANDDFKKYHKRLLGYREYIRDEMNRNLGKKVAFLRKPLNELLSDPGAKKQEVDKETKEVRVVPDPEYPDLTELWANSDSSVQALRTRILNLYEEFAYGDPFILASQYGGGRVVVVLSTAGRRWSGWSGGTSDQPSAFTVFLDELQKYLSSQGSQSTFNVGSGLTLTIDEEVFKQRGVKFPQVKRSFVRPMDGKPAEVLFKEDLTGKEKDGVLSFALSATNHPGLSVTELLDPTGQVVTSVAHVFNVDAQNEGPLQRTSSLSTLFEESRAKSVSLVTPTSPTAQIVDEQSVFAETPLFFLILLFVLIAEQALAVHLSFHLKGDELPMPTQARTQSPARAA